MTVIVIVLGALVVVVAIVMMARAARRRSASAGRRAIVPESGAGTAPADPPSAEPARTAEAAQAADPTYDPSPIGSEVAELVDRFTDLGMRVEWSTSGDVEVLPAAIGAAALLAVRDALTAARAHGEQRVKLSMARTRRNLEITVLRDLPGAQSADAVAEDVAHTARRVAALGGAVQTVMIRPGEPDAQGRVVVTMPIGDQPATG